MNPLINLPIESLEQDLQPSIATLELLAIPGLSERIQQQQLTPQIYRAWREIRSDV
jgi:hypothetical protein